VELRDRAEAAGAAAVDGGAAAALVTVGAGVAVDRGSERWWVDAPEVTVRNPIEAGDSLVSGLVGSLERSKDFQEAVRVGVAAGSAGVETELPGLLDPENVRALLPQVAGRNR
jgi:6-phosphofructokinase 2